MSYPQTCQCKEDWTDGTGICQECHLKRINTQADLHAVVDFIRETEKLEAQVAEWMGVANQQILRIQELEQKLDKSDALTRQALCWLRHYRYLAGNLHKTYDTREAEDATLDAFLSRLDARIVEQPKASTATTSERDSALALAKEAVEVLEGTGCHCMPERQCEVCAFLARPDVVKIGGGK